MKQSIQDFGAPVVTLTNDVSFLSYDEKMEILKSSLLELGGERFSFPRAEEDDIDALITDGLAFAPDDLMIATMPGDDHRCHNNSAECWNVNRDKSLIVTGYALFDSTWMQHTWLMCGDVDNGSEPTLVETTEIADEYYGIVLNQEQCELFYQNNAI